MISTKVPKQNHTINGNMQENGEQKRPISMLNINQKLIDSLAEGEAKSFNSLTHFMQMNSQGSRQFRKAL
jgi:hypothetical protein